MLDLYQEEKKRLNIIKYPVQELKITNMRIYRYRYERTKSKMKNKQTRNYTFSSRLFLVHPDDEQFENF